MTMTEVEKLNVLMEEKDSRVSKLEEEKKFIERGLFDMEQKAVNMERLLSKALDNLDDCKNAVALIDAKFINSQKKLKDFGVS